MSSPSSTPAPDDALSIIVLGASGDLAHKKTYPALYDLFKANLLPAKSLIIGYARSDMSADKFRSEISKSLLKKSTDAEEVARVTAFMALCTYVAGPYDSPAGFSAAVRVAEAFEISGGTAVANRIYYMAIPPTVFKDAASTIKAVGKVRKGCVARGNKLA